MRGAVIRGIESANRQNVVYARTCPRSYGMVFYECGSMVGFQDRYTDSVTGALVDDHITWLVKKGDLVLSNSEGPNFSKEFQIEFLWTEEAVERKKSLSIFEYEDDDLPTLYSNSYEGIVYINPLSISHALTNARYRAKTGCCSRVRFLLDFVG